MENLNSLSSSKLIVKFDQLERVEQKVWGHEEWIVNKSKYCGKKLVVKKGYRCSLHYHKVKEETFYVLCGKIILEVVCGDEKKVRLMNSGDIEHIQIGALHRFTAIENAELIEFSTHHMEEDSYRKEPSGEINNQELENLILQAR